MSPRVDPSDTGGLFIGRRPGTRPPRYRAVPERGGPARRRFDFALSAALLALMTLVGVSFWGPIPAGWLWIGSQIQYRLDSVIFALFVAFIGMTLTLMLGLKVMKVIDLAWILVRRAAGHDQRQGVLGTIFVISTGIGVTLFTAWLLLLSGARLSGGGIG